ncbi:MAG: hypothetical protein K2X94_03385 [Amoebophilaceae bacterium]|nr:hypothetical protein [Amoebophilaceae bacterium]
MNDNNLQFSFTLLDGTTFYLADFQLVLVVNTASQCGFAKQLSRLQALHERYQGRGFTVLGVASQSFGKQEFQAACDIESAIKKRAAITFPMTQLTAVIGEAIHPFYAWAAGQVSLLGRPKWNFHKYLVSNNPMTLIDWFSSVTDPLGGKVIGAIEAALSNGQKASS